VTDHIQHPQRTTHVVIDSTEFIPLCFRSFRNQSRTQHCLVATDVFRSPVVTRTVHTSRC